MSGLHVYIPHPDRYVSRYSLLGAFATELMQAFAHAGCQVNTPTHTPGEPAIVVFFNTPQSVQALVQWVHSTVGDIRRAAILHYYVDHPLTLPAQHMDVMSNLPNYRLLLPCRDDAHVLRFRWPRLKHITCVHGVPRSSLCDASTLEREHTAQQGTGGREIPLFVCGTIHSQPQLDEMRSQLPDALYPTCDAIIDLLTRTAHLSFCQAFDLCLTAGITSPDHWRLLSSVQQYTTAVVNRVRRSQLVVGLREIPTLLVGPPAWEEFCSGNIQYGGEIPYADVASNLARSRVCLAWGPTQFAHTYSERLLLSMAAGCATISDDRVLSGRDFAPEGTPPACALVDFSHPEEVAEVANLLLSSPDQSAILAARGRKAVEAGHLWEHRLPTFVHAAEDAFHTPWEQAPAREARE